MYVAALAPGALRDPIYRGQPVTGTADRARSRTNWGIPLVPALLTMLAVLPWEAPYYTILRIAMTTAALV